MTTSRDAEYLKRLEDATEIVEKMHNDMTDWKVSKTSKHVKIWSKKSPAFHGYMHRIECIVDVPLERAFEYFLPSPLGLRDEWDKTLQLHECFGELAEHTHCFRVVTHSQMMGLIASREFVYVLRIIRKPEKGLMYTTCISIDHPKYPQNSAVRGINYPCGSYFEVIPETNQVRVTNYYHVDLGGKIPQSVMDSTIPQLMAGVMESYYKKLQSIKK